MSSEGRGIGERSLMDNRIEQALRQDRTIDITTTGRTSGLPRRIETWFYRVGDDIYLTGSPGRRDWYANLLANPWFTFHLKQSVAADLPGRAIPITDPVERRTIFTAILGDLGQPESLEAWLSGSPLVAVNLEPARSSGRRHARAAVVPTLQVGGNHFAHGAQGIENSRSLDRAGADGLAAG